jgi:hypothetical protein
VAGTFSNVNTLLRTLVLLGLVGVGGWWTVFLRGKLQARDLALQEQTVALEETREDLQQSRAELVRVGDALQGQIAENTRLAATVAELERRVEAVELANRLLKVEHRVARMEVLAIGATADEPDRVRTTVRFTELGADGEPLRPGRELTVEGRTIYVDSLVIQFEDRYVEEGDALRGTSLCLFRRLFGEEQKPSEGVPLDPAGQQPFVYGGDTLPSPVHDALWDRFWDYANDPALARELGVRALQGEAPFVEARVGMTYRLELRSSGGLVIQAE